MFSTLFLLPFLFAATPPAHGEPSQAEHHAFRLRPGQDLKGELTRYIEQHKLRACAVVTCVGSLTEANLRYAGEPGGTVVEGPLEIIALTGCGGDGRWHLHLSVSDKNGVMRGGHLLDGSTVRTTAEIVLVELKEKVFTRTHDESTGYPELEVRPRK